MVTIYILLLEQDKYYIGKSKNPNTRIEQHFNSNGSSWTQKYKPVNVVETLYNCDSFDEDKYTLKYMAKFGINNVRGGSFCEITLSNDNISTIQKMLKSSHDKCYICGESGHFANQCKQYQNNIFNNISNIVSVFAGLFSYLQNFLFLTKSEKDNNDFNLLNNNIIYLCKKCDKDFNNLKNCENHEKNCKRINKNK
jgi:hypothetical protein